MSEIETLPCPSCGEDVKTSGGPAKMEWNSESGTKSSATEIKTCPHCGAALEREVMAGAPWRVVAGGGEAPASA